MGPSSSIDTNILVHAIIQEPRAQYLNCCNLLRKPGHKYRVFDTAIIEAVFVFNTFYEQERIAVAKNLTLFFEQFGEALDYNRTIVKMILPFWVEHPALSFVDCYLAFMAGLGQVEPLITLDTKLANQHPSAILIPKS